MKKTFIILSFVMLITIFLSSALTFTQSVPAPTTSNLLYISSFNGYVFTATATLGNCYLSKPIDNYIFNEIYCPDDTAVLGTTTNATFVDSVQKMSDGSLMMLYKNTSTANNFIARYYPSNNSYSYFPFNFNISGGLICMTDFDVCYVQAINKSVYSIYPTNEYIAPSPASSGYLILSNWKLMSIDGSACAGDGCILYEWTGINWKNVGQPATSLGRHIYVTERKRVVDGSYGRVYNYTTGTFGGMPQSLGYFTKAAASSNMILTTQFSGAGHSPVSVATWDNLTFINTSIPYSHASTARIIDYDSINNVFWIAGTGGIIYYSSDASVDISTNTTMNITVSATSSCINRTIRLNVNAYTSNTTIQDLLTYDYNCDGSSSLGEPPNDYRTGEFFCGYTTSGMKNIFGYAIFDDGTTRDYLYANQTVNITNCSGNYSVMGTAFDYDNGEPIIGVNVALSTGQTATSDSNGNVIFIVNTSGTYTVVLTKDNYEPLDTTATTTSITGWYMRSLSGSEGGIRTTLRVITVNTDGTPINRSLVSVLDPITGQSMFGITDNAGRYFFVDIFTGSQIIVSGSNEPKNYLPTQEYMEILFGNNYEITLTLTNKTVVGVYYGNARMCVDSIKGVLLCGNLSVTGSGSGCLVDADCISDRCMPSKTCSNFNWTICDSHGLTRGQYCFTRSIAEGGLSGLTNLIFSFFIFVCVILFILGIFILVKKRNN